MNYMGRCVGGPLDGQTYVCWRQTMPLEMPMVRFPSVFKANVDPDKCEVSNVIVGRYEYQDGCWVWRPYQVTP